MQLLHFLQNILVCTTNLVGDGRKKKKDDDERLIRITDEQTKLTAPT
jgi:hypothetical protein